MKKIYKNLPLITVITPTYNLIDQKRRQKICECIDSVNRQTYENIEHIIIDGASDDGTIHLIENIIKNKKRVHIVSESDAGIYDAMNKGVSMAKGEWIYFLGSDDILHDANVFNRIFSNSDNERFDFIYGNVLVGDTGKIYDRKFSQLKLVEKNICHQAIFFRKMIFKKCGKFNTKYKVVADWDFNMKIFSSDDIRKKYVDIIVAKYDLNGFSSLNSDDIFKSDLENILKKRFPDENKIRVIKEENTKLHSDIKIAKEENTKLHSDIKIAKEENTKLHSDIKIAKEENTKLRKRIMHMQSSKFWKMRENYINLKNKIKK